MQPNAWTRIPRSSRTASTASGRRPRLTRPTATRRDSRLPGATPDRCSARPTNYKFARLPRRMDQGAAPSGLLSLSARSGGHGGIGAAPWDCWVAVKKGFAIGLEDGEFDVGRSLIPCWARWRGGRTRWTAAAWRVSEGGGRLGRIEARGPTQAIRLGVVVLIWGLVNIWRCGGWGCSRWGTR
jgi:hypothetical protein